MNCWETYNRLTGTRSIRSVFAQNKRINKHILRFGSAFIGGGRSSDTKHLPASSLQRNCTGVTASTMHVCSKKKHKNIRSVPHKSAAMRNAIDIPIEGQAVLLDLIHPNMGWFSRSRTECFLNDRKNGSVRSQYLKRKASGRCYGDF